MLAYIPHFFCVDIGDINNNCNDGPPSLTVQTQLIDPKEHRRQRDRERYAQMDSTKKEEYHKRQREARQKKVINVEQG